MVENISDLLMISPSSSPRRGICLPSPFGSCKQGWYYRCLGLDPRRKVRITRGGTRLLISVTVVGSAGPLRFVVNEEMLVAAVIDTALKSYAREGRLPILGSNLDNFVLYCPNYSSEGLSPWETIGSTGVRNFMMCKKPQAEKAIDVGKTPMMSTRKRHASWRAWLKNKSLKISSH